MKSTHIFCPVLPPEFKVSCKKKSFTLLREAKMKTGRWPPRRLASFRRGIKSLLNEPVRAETDSWNREGRERLGGRSQERERESGEIEFKIPSMLSSFLLPPRVLFLVGRSVGRLGWFSYPLSKWSECNRAPPPPQPPQIYREPLEILRNLFFGKTQTLGRDKLQKES